MAKPRMDLSAFVGTSSRSRMATCPSGGHPGLSQALMETEVACGWRPCSDARFNRSAEGDTAIQQAAGSRRKKVRDAAVSALERIKRADGTERSQP
jgi:hypothetical protein